MGEQSGVRTKKVTNFYSWLEAKPSENRFDAILNSVSNLIKSSCESLFL